MNTIIRTVLSVLVLSAGIEASAQNTLFETTAERSTAAVSSATGEQLYSTPESNITNTLYGLLPGLSVMEGSGRLGYDMAKMAIRGKGTFNSEDSFIVLVDGFQTDISFIEYMLPSEIEHIYVLKDAAALSTLGMKGANGAILIETKRGREGATTVTFNARTGIHNPIQITKPLGSFEYASLYNEAISNDNGRVWFPTFDAATLTGYKDGTGVNTDWYDETLRSNSFLSSTDVSVSGGAKNLKFFTTLGYVRNEGFYDVANTDRHKNAAMDQYVIRTNLDFTMFDIFEGRVDIGGRMADNFSPNFDEDYLWWNLETYPNNIYTPYDGELKDMEHFSGTQTYNNNPIASTKGLGYKFLRERTFMTNLSLKEKLDFITPGLYLMEAASFAAWTKGTYILSRNYARLSGDVPQTSDLNTDYSISDDNGTNAWFWNQFKLQAGYDRTFGRNAVTAAVVYEQYHRNVDGDMNGNAGSQTAYAHQAINGRANYAYDGRYVAELGFSWCGSDNYMKGNRFAFFPTASFAWVASNEEFLKGNDVVNFLKVRASMGTTGYDYFAGGRYLYYQRYTSGNSFPTGNSASASWNSSTIPAFVADPNITSEVSLKQNIGINATLFKHWDLGLDVYRDHRTGIIVQDNSYSAGFGADAPYRNVGEVTSGGIEFTTAYTRSFGDFSLGFSGMASFCLNRINYMAEIATPSPLAAKTGNPIGSIFGYESDGFYDVTDFDATGQLLPSIATPSMGTVQPGDLRYRNRNGDNVIDDRDMVKISDGGSNPDLYYAFTLNFGYKNFELSMLFQGVGGREVNLMDSPSKFKAFNDYSTIYSIAEGRWAYYPEIGIDTRKSATYPRLSTQDNTNNYVSSDFWIKNGDYLKLRNLEFGYNLSDKTCKSIGIRDAKVYVCGVNVLTFGNLKKMYNVDPERIAGYPAVKSWNLGISISF